MSRQIVVCGAGSAGCTLAARLSEDAETTVTLLEAGADYRQVEDLPEEIRSAWIFGVPDHDWGYTSEAVTEASNVPSWSIVNAGEVPMPRGKVVGGSSAVNGTNALRALPVDFRRWQGISGVGSRCFPTIESSRMTQRREAGTDRADRFASAAFSASTRHR